MKTIVKIIVVVACVLGTTLVVSSSCKKKNKTFPVEHFLIHKSLITPSDVEANAFYTRYGNDEAVETYQVVDINLEVLAQVNDIKMVIFSDTIVVNEKNKYVRGNRDFTWFGDSNDFLSSVSISVLDDDIQGVITHGNEVYTIATFEHKYILLKMNQVDFDEGNDVYED